jgi:hypothetical protein
LVLNKLIPLQEVKGEEKDESGNAGGQLDELQQQNLGPNGLMKRYSRLRRYSPG